MNRNTFDKNSTRCKNGMRFQNRVQREMMNEFHNVDNTREGFSRDVPYLTNIQLNILEQTHGDIVGIIGNQIVFIECVSVNTDGRSPFPESKIQKFYGDSKWYAVGWDGYGPKFIHSRTLNSYMRKRPSFLRGGRKYRDLRRRNIQNIDNCFVGVNAFVDHLKGDP